ncbi:hypothetical protein V6N13_130639 [Hibiscus sabdariffa]
MEVGKTLGKMKMRLKMAMRGERESVDRAGDTTDTCKSKTQGSGTMASTEETFHVVDDWNNSLGLGTLQRDSGPRLVGPREVWDAHVDGLEGWRKEFLGLRKQSVEIFILI